jgi:hypothetical protein
MTADHLGLIAWATGITLLAVLLVAVKAVAEFRRLKRRGTPRPFYLLWQRTGARFVPSARIRHDVDGLEGRLVWVDWDIHTVASGETMARVVSSRLGNDLVLGLDTPIVVAGQDPLPDVRLDIVTFIPSRVGVVPYQRCAVPGKLAPPIMPGLEATAQVVVYPAQHVHHPRSGGGR